MTVDQPLRVAFDVTPLGRARYYPRGRTGIFRVTAELLAALSRTAVALDLVAYDCRSEAQDEVERLGLATQVQRSSLDRLLFPLLRRAFVPRALPVTQALSASRRKALRSLVQVMESYDGRHRRAMERADVCHSVYLPVSWLGLSGRRRARGLITVHDLLPITHPDFFPDEDRALLDSVLLDIRRGSFAHCVSEHTRQQLIGIVPEAQERSFVAPLAADPTKFFVPEPARVDELRRRLGLLGEKYLLCLGTLDPRKNLQTALAAFAGAHAKCARLRLVVVGATARSAPSWESLLTSVPTARAACVAPGFVEDRDLPALYAGAAAVLFPSLAEGFGLPVLEAMQCGAPVIVSNRTSLPEVVGGAGVLLDPLDTAAWTAAILAIVGSPELAQTYTARSLARSSQFDWARTAIRLAGAYASIAGGRAPECPLR